MKNKIYQLSTVSLMLVALLLTAGCKKYTEVQPVSQYSIPQVYSDVAMQPQLLLACMMNCREIMAMVSVLACTILTTVMKA